ncbi:hypothetical protein [Candidatus Lokiarchaeum ossiferum]|uniref:hypothetical protein n=1 Tax=Candidatus Lokiarchaeum ossiferum TaxID=2951803 RepID=UPI00352F083C
MPKIVNISFPKDGTELKFSLPDQTIEYMQSLVDQGEYRSLPDALSAFTLEAINLNNPYRKAMKYPVDYPFPSEKCPVCKKAELEIAHPQTQLLGYLKHCPVCYYSFQSCPTCSTGNIYRIDKEVQDHIVVIEYCTNCDFEKEVMISENFRYIDFQSIL